MDSNIKKTGKQIWWFEANMSEKMQQDDGVNKNLKYWT